MNENHEEPSDSEAAKARERFENEKMTRREALRRIGMAGGMAIFAMLSADDLARMAAKKLQEHEASKGIGDTLAKEFRSAGVAFANPSGPYYPPNPSGPPPPPPNPSGPNLDDPCGCDAAFITCKGTAPAGCNPSGGSLWPWCAPYNFNLWYVFTTQRTACYSSCDDLAT